MANCVICNREGPGSKNFICDGCGQEGKVMLFCAKCQRREELESCCLDFFRKKYNMNIPSAKGYVVKVSCCVKCNKDKKTPFKLQVFGLRDQGEYIN